MTCDVTNHGTFNNVEGDSTTPKGVLANITNDGTFKNTGYVGETGKTVTNNTSGTINNSGTNGLIASDITNTAESTINAMNGKNSNITTPVSFDDGAYVKVDANILNSGTDHFVDGNTATTKYLTNLNISGAE